MKIPPIVKAFVVLQITLSASAAPLRLLDVADAVNRPKYLPTDCTTRVVTADGRPALELAFGHRSSWPQLRLDSARFGYPTNWSAYAFLAVTVSNPTRIPVSVNLRVDSAADRARGRQGGALLAPGQRARLLMPIDTRESIVGMRGQPPVAYNHTPNDVELGRNASPFDPTSITHFQIFLGHPRTNHTLRVHEIALLPADAAANPAFVDRFGQYNGANWPGKLHDEGELTQRRRDEDADFAAHPPPPDRDTYGGWQDGPKLEATGRFRVQKHGGKWWFVDPDGRLFWSNGITCVRINAATIIAGRRQYYEWLPENNDPLARFYSGRGAHRTYDFFAANVFRKYGNDYAAAFFDTTMRRFRSWGINTVANWSAPETWRLKRVPYTIPIGTPNVPSFVATSHQKAGLEKKKWFPDPFDPKFRERLDERLAAQAEYRDDPWLLGVFIDNELPWVLGSPWLTSGRAPTGIGLLCLERNDDSFLAKRRLLEWLKAHYAAIGELNRAWGTAFADWAALSAPFSISDEQRARALSDLRQLDVLIAEQYFRVCRETLNARMPGVLYLGCRFSGMYDRHIVDVARRYCDVVSFNIYGELPTDRTVDELATELDFPVVIGEFHFGALDRGMFDPGLRRAADQTERAAKYAAYVRSAAAAPWCIGAHWFQYVDQALTGRADGENYNIGFVDATDDPYPEMRDAARRVSAGLYRLRQNQR